jgi:hypothetical protein
MHILALSLFQYLIVNKDTTCRKQKSYLRLAWALAPELVLELPELLEDELERDVDPELELWDELDPLDDRELLSDELQVDNTIRTITTLGKI